MAIRRAAWVLVSFSTSEPATTAIDRRMTNERAAKSMSDHRMPHASPRRAPVAAITRRSVPNSALCASARSSRSKALSIPGGTISLRRIAGGLALTAGLALSQPHLTAWFSAPRITACT